MAWDTHPSLVFNGTTVSVSCGSATAIDNLHDNAFTVEAWIKATDAGEGNLGRIFDKGTWIFFLTTDGGGIRLRGFIDCATTDAIADSASALIANSWVHVAMTWDDATFTTPKLYINGEVIGLQGTSNRNGAVVTDAANTLFRGNSAAGTRAFNGQQGWARISNVVRYTANFAAPDRFTPPAVDANTIVLHPTDEGTGTNLDDAANNADGTISNGTWATQSQGEYASAYTLITGSGVNALFASRVPHQRNCFYAKGRYWVFYGEYDAGGTPYDLYYTSSTDGITWATPTNLTTFPLADAQWGVHYDETYDRLHVAKNTQSSSPPVHDGLLYRLGTPNTDGTITWAAAFQTAIATGNGVGDFSIASDSTGLVWIGYGDGDTADGGVDGDAKCIKNANTDGTWSTVSGFPATIKAGVTDDAFAILAPLDDGTMIAVVYEWQQDEQAVAYLIAANGTVTTDESPVTNSNVEAASGTGAKVARIEIDSVADGVVHLAYQDTSQNIKYKSRAANGTWSSETTLSDNTRVTDVISSPRISFGEGDYLYVMWSKADQFYITQSADGGATWETPVSVRLTTLEATYEHCMPSHKANSERLALTQLGGSFQLRHHLLWVGNTVEADSVAPDDCLHSHVAESPSITQVHIVTVNDALHGHTAESPTITQVHTISPSECLHVHAADSPIITQVHGITPADCLHSHTAESPTVSDEFYSIADTRAVPRLFDNRAGERRFDSRANPRIFDTKADAR